MSPRRTEPTRRVVSLPVAALVALVTALAGGGGGAAINRVANETQGLLKERLARIEGRVDTLDRTVGDLREAKADTGARLVQIEQRLTSIDGKLDRLAEGGAPRRR